MLVNIEQVKITDRIRKDFGDMQELADDIRENGLINPPVVTPNTFELIAGERRLKAMKLLGYQQIEVRPMSVKDAEHQLNLEISENETRKDFSKKERIDYARRLERIEKVKADKRRAYGNTCPESEKGVVADIVASKLGIGSGENYRKEKYIVDNADISLLSQWDKGDISTHAAYTIIKSTLATSVKRNNIRKPIPSITIKHLISRSGSKCEICKWGGSGLEGVLVPHHIHKYSETEDNSLNNLTLVCPNCHSIIHTLENCNDSGIKEIISKNISFEYIYKINAYVELVNASYK